MQDEGYFAEQVQPHVDGDRVRYLGSVGPEQRSELLGRRRPLLHPIAFAEPFGLSVVEAMAAGTPVIAYPRGSMPEVVDEGVTGFLVDRRRRPRRPRSSRPSAWTARRSAAWPSDRFSAERMVDDYLAVYESLLR